MHSCLLIYFLILVETLKIADICQLGLTIVKKLEVLHPLCQYTATAWVPWKETLKKVIVCKIRVREIPLGSTPVQGRGGQEECAMQGDRM